MLFEDAVRVAVVLSGSVIVIVIVELTLKPVPDMVAALPGR